jgi:hypothetical protein
MQGYPTDKHGTEDVLEVIVAGTCADSEEERFEAL